jgi:alkaline phosphatase
MKTKLTSGLLAASLVATSILTTAATAEEVATVSAANQAESKNLIVLIGDGMGPAQVTLGRLYAQKYLGMNKLYLDDYLIGMNSTYAGDSSYKGQSGIVTDSAASATAFGSGIKTYNGAISVTNEEVAKPVASVLEAAEWAGKATGLISTARITHATPAAYASHVRQRGMENAIASQYAESGVDVLLGGGERHFTANEETAHYGKTKREDNKDLVKQFKDAGYAVVYNKEELTKFNGEKLVGFFDDSHVPYNLDRGAETPDLADQLTKAIEVLEKDKDGFVIMLEGGRIDHAGHANDAHSVAKETIEFDKAFKAAIDYAKANPGTSVMVTADHETGGMSVGSRSQYNAYLDIMKQQTASSEKIGSELNEAEDAAAVRAIVEKYTGIKDLSEAEVNLIVSGNEWDGSKSSYGREGSFNAVMSYRTLIGWTGHGHTGVDVGVYAYGPVADDITGFTDNTDFAKEGAKTLGLDLNAATAKLQAKYLYPKFMESREGKILFPATILGEALGVEVKWDAAAKRAVLKGSALELKVDPKDAKAMINGKTVVGATEQSRLYLPLEAFEALTGKDLTWDSLSERIVLP